MKNCSLTESYINSRLMGFDKDETIKCLNNDFTKKCTKEINQPPEIVRSDYDEEFYGIDFDWDYTLCPPMFMDSDILYEMNLHTIGVIDFLKDNFPEKKIYKVTGPSIIYNYKPYEMKTIKLVTENKFKEFADYIANCPSVFIDRYMIKILPKEEHKIRFGYVTLEDINENSV